MARILASGIAKFIEWGSDMKLVDILARELKVWPHSGDAVGQASDNTLHLNERSCHGGQLFRWTKEKFTEAEDWGGAFVTRAEWQAAVDALNAGKVVEWDGAGLPCAGAKVEYLLLTSGGDLWRESEVKFVGSDWIIIGGKLQDKGLDFFEATLNHKLCGGDVSAVLRPIRTPEQIAAEV